MAINETNSTWRRTLFGCGESNVHDHWTTELGGIKKHTKSVMGRLHTWGNPIDSLCILCIMMLGGGCLFG